MDLCPRDLKSLALDQTRPLPCVAFRVNTGLYLNVLIRVASVVVAVGSSVSVYCDCCLLRQCF